MFAVDPLSAINLPDVGKTPGTRQATIPDDVWRRAFPILAAKIGPVVLAKDVAAAVGVSKAAVSQWINDRARPNQTNLIRCLQFLGEDPAVIVPELVPVQRAEKRDAVDDALLRLIYENPMKATAYVLAAAQQRTLSVSDSATVEEMIWAIRKATGEREK